MKVTGTIDDPVETEIILDAEKVDENFEAAKTKTETLSNENEARFEIDVRDEQVSLLTDSEGKWLK